jgi:hypothetical protein
MTFQNIPWEKYIHAMSAIIHMSSLPHGFAMWTFDNRVFVKINIRIKTNQGQCAMCWSKKKKFAPLLRILSASFKHVLCGKILFVNIDIFYTTAFMVVVILAIVMGDKLNIVVTWTCQQKTCLDIIIIYTIQKYYDKRYFNRSNNIIVK